MHRKRQDLRENFMSCSAASGWVPARNGSSLHLLSGLSSVQPTASITGSGITKEFLLDETNVRKKRESVSERRGEEERRA